MLLENQNPEHKSQAERFAEHQELPQFFSTRLAFALQEAGVRFFEDLSHKLDQYQEDLMLTPRFDFQSEREEFLEIKWIIKELADITVDYDESEINTMIKKETKLLTNHFLRNQNPPKK